MLPGARMIRLPRSTRSKVLQALTCALCVLLLASTSAGQRDRQIGQQSSPALRQAISEAAKKYNIPGIAVAWIEHGQLRAVELFGVRDLKSNAPITTNTVFEAGSLGEPVYAYSVLLLSADGRFNPGTPLTAYLPLPYMRDLDPLFASHGTEPLYDPALAHVNAIRVMNHTSGFPDWARKQNLRLQSPPGQKWSYSNEGYLYLQHAVEQFSGESFEDFVARSVLRPGVMIHSSFTWQEAYSGVIATAYDRTGAPLDAQRYLRPAAAATLYTTIQDYTRFIQHLLASASIQQAHESAVTLMLRPTVAVEAANSFSWGMGLGLEKRGDDLFFFQRGNNPGFQSFVIASRNSGTGLIILTNSSNGLDAVPAIIAATIGGNHPILKSAFLQAR
jgi:CubicO group peptidase (beta-lactamase class C family)